MENIKPVWRKRMGIFSILMNNLALFYSLYKGADDFAEVALYVNAVCIMCWYFGEAFVGKLIMEKFKYENENNSNG